MGHIKEVRVAAYERARSGLARCLTMNAVRIPLVMMVACLVSSAGGAQSADSERSLARVALALQSAGPIDAAVTTLRQPVLKGWGGFTLAPPDKSGEMVRVAIPIGAVVTRSAHATAAARRRRAAARVHDEVEGVLIDLRKQP